MMNWLKKLMLLIKTNKIFFKKMENVDKKITNIRKFILIQDLNRLIKMNFNARMAEASKNLAPKNQ